MRDWDVSIRHIFREAKMSADWLPRQGAMDRESLVIWDNPPRGMGNVLLADAMGLSIVGINLYSVLI